MKLVCKQCGKEFELSESEINFYKSKNLHLPKRCKECRQANKNNAKKSVLNSSTVSTNGYYNQPGNNNGRNTKWIAAILIVAILLSVGGIVLSNLDQINRYSDTAQPSYDTVSPLPEEIHNQTGEVKSEFGRKTEVNSEPEIEEEVSNHESGTGTEELNSEPAAEDEAAKNEPESEAEIVEEASTQADTGSAPIYKFRNDELLNEHFEKHGIEMGFATAKEYQEAASAVVTNENALHKLEAEDGDDVYYLEASNDFVIVSTDGYIRTYFKPNSGIEYYNRQ